jgi:hypothetical protein
MYSIELISTERPVCCAWKHQNCGRTGWIFLADIDSVGRIGTMHMTGGTTYYVLMDDPDTIAGIHQFYIDYLGMPDLGYYAHVIDDSENTGAGAHNCVAEPGETVKMILTIQNKGNYDGHNVSVNVSAEDPDIHLMNDHVSFGDIGTGDTASCEGTLQFSIPVDCQEEKDVIILLEINSREGSWLDTFSLHIGPNRTSIRGAQVEDLFTLFPNPTEDFIHVRFNRFISCNLELKSINGQQLFEKTLDGKECTIDVTSFPPGIYFITVRSGSSLKTKKLIKLIR